MTESAQFNSGALYFISWLDHVTHHTSSWHPVEEINELSPCVIESIGWVVKEDDQCVWVLNHVGDNESYADAMCIVKSCILDKKDMTYALHSE